MWGFGAPRRGGGGGGFLPSALLVAIYLVSAVISWIPSDKPITVPEDGDEQCFNETCGVEFNPYSPLIKCSYIPLEFIECEPPVDHHGNTTAQEELGYGCVKFGGQRYEEVANTSVLCQALQHIECHGNRTFLRPGYPCIKYSGHYFVKTLIYSVLLGFLGMDRFCLGHTGTAVGKLLTVGGVGIWWIVDVILLVSGDLRPADDSNWVPYY